MNDQRAVQAQPSKYLSFLPEIYQESHFLGRFLRIFEDILSPIQKTVDTIPVNFDPRLAPLSMLAFLATWVGQERNRLPEERWRQLVKEALELHRWRGTKYGLRLALELATGYRPLITEYSGGLVLASDSSLGLNTPLKDGVAPHISVVFACAPEQVDARLARDIIRDCSPAHVSYDLTFQS